MRLENTSNGESVLKIGGRIGQGEAQGLQGLLLGRSDQVLTGFGSRTALGNRLHSPQRLAAPQN
jgi:hypothetical protein